MKLTRNVYITIFIGMLLLIGVSVPSGAQELETAASQGHGRLPEKVAPAV